MPVQEKPLQYTKWWFFMKQPRVLLSAGKRWRRFSTTETQNMQRDKLKYNLRKIAKGLLDAAGMIPTIKFVWSALPQKCNQILCQNPFQIFPNPISETFATGICQHFQCTIKTCTKIFPFLQQNFETPPLKINFDIYLFLGQGRNTSRVYGGQPNTIDYFKCFSLKFKLNQDNIALFWSKTEASDSWGRQAMDEVRFCCYFQCHRGTANVCWFDHNISFPIVTVKISTIQYFKELQKKSIFQVLKCFIIIILTIKT